MILELIPLSMCVWPRPICSSLQTHIRRRAELTTVLGSLEAGLGPRLSGVTHTSTTGCLHTAGYGQSHRLHTPTACVRCKALQRTCKALRCMPQVAGRAIDVSFRVPRVGI